MLWYRLGRNLAKSSPTRPTDKQIVFELIRKANSGGWWAQLLVATRDSRPQNPDLLAFAQEIGLAVAAPVAPPAPPAIPAPASEPAPVGAPAPGDRSWLGPLNLDQWRARPGRHRGEGLPRRNRDRGRERRSRRPGHGIPGRTRSGHNRLLRRGVRHHRRDPTPGHRHPLRLQTVGRRRHGQSRDRVSTRRDKLVGSHQPRRSHCRRRPADGGLHERPGNSTLPCSGSTERPGWSRSAAGESREPRGANGSRRRTSRRSRRPARRCTWCNTRRAGRWSSKWGRSGSPLPPKALPRCGIRSGRPADQAAPHASTIGGGSSRCTTECCETKGKTNALAS